MERLTENKAIERLQCMRLFMEINDKQNDSKFLEDDYIANEMAIKALEEIQQYRAIGTIEEFKALKMNKTVLPIATITFNKEDMQKIVDEKVAQIELDIQEIRAKAIDEFAEKLKLYYQGYDINLCFEDNLHLSYADSCNVFESYIDDIAEQMKAGGIDG